MSDVRVGLVGYGTAGQVFHAPLIAATPGLRLASVVTRSPERAAEVAERYGAATVPSLDDVLGACDLVVIASPNRTHVPFATAALEAGLPVVVDKPLAADAAQAEELVRLARERGLMLTVFQNRRWDGDFLTLRRIAPDLGEVHRFESRFERWRPRPKGGWRETGGAEDLAGLLYDLGSHLVDQALQLFGPVESVYAEVLTRRAGVNADDDTFVALTHASGTRSHLWVSSVAADLGPRFRVLGSRGAYVKHGMDVQEEQLRAGLTPGSPGFGDDPEERWGVAGAGDELKPVPTERGDYAAFYRAVADGRTPVDPSGVVEALAVLEAARRSAETTQTVRLS
ncbi:Gfo/Idh/MocA family oxidoreductase [Nonomuraea soli]|uniref:Putative dehydrogenase n=1 Tax=Nonomuraea soli TaxID=1032476 RepID=A0A7W0CSH0_9ACTN|nr:Gfo/Idh/MocA family oxidoreductase [Nonomuraea soli]MBA2896509.1 putative dehydrogenase [Nonomuraea soli]